MEEKIKYNFFFFDMGSIFHTVVKKSVPSHCQELVESKYLSNIWRFAIFMNKDSRCLLYELKRKL